MSIVFRRSSFSWLARPGANPATAVWLPLDPEVDEVRRRLKRAVMRSALAIHGSESRLLRAQWNLYPRAPGRVFVEG